MARRGRARAGGRGDGHALLEHPRLLDRDDGGHRPGRELGRAGRDERVLLRRDLRRLAELVVLARRRPGRAREVGLWLHELYRVSRLLLLLLRWRRAVHRWGRSGRRARGAVGRAALLLLLLPIRGCTGCALLSEATLAPESVMGSLSSSLASYAGESTLVRVLVLNEEREGCIPGWRYVWLNAPERFWWRGFVEVEVDGSFVAVVVVVGGRDDMDGSMAAADAGVYRISRIAK